MMKRYKEEPGEIRCEVRCLQGTDAEENWIRENNIDRKFLRAEGSLYEA